MFMTRDKRKIKELEVALTEAKRKNTELAQSLAKYESNYPLNIGDIVYDVQLRSAAGRFTKTKASREQSIINEVEVTKKNYFGLVDRYYSFDVFKSMQEAQDHIEAVCID